MLTCSGHLGFFPAALLHSSYDCTLCYLSPLHFPSQDLAQNQITAGNFFQPQVNLLGLLCCIKISLKSVNKSEKITHNHSSSQLSEQHKS